MVRIEFIWVGLLVWVVVNVVNWDDDGGVVVNLVFVDDVIIDGFVCDYLY